MPQWIRTPLLAPLLCGLAAVAVACGGKEPERGASAPPPPPAGDVAEQEATQLGRDVFGLLDRLASYAASNQRKYPASLREAGIDSLTPKIARQIDTRAQPPMAFGSYEVQIAQLASFVPVQPLAKLAVTPDDFPFLAQIRGHDDRRLGEYAAALQTGAPWPVDP